MIQPIICLLRSISYRGRGVLLTYPCETIWLQKHISCCLPNQHNSTNSVQLQPTWQITALSLPLQNHLRLRKGSCIRLQHSKPNFPLCQASSLSIFLISQLLSSSSSLFLLYQKCGSPIRGEELGL